MVARFDFLFIWDEDIGADAFDANRRAQRGERFPRAGQGCKSASRRYIELVQEHALDISQPAVAAGPISWPVTRRVAGSVLHRRALARGPMGP